MLDPMQLYIEHIDHIRTRQQQDLRVEGDPTDLLCKHLRNILLLYSISRDVTIGCHLGLTIEDFPLLI